MDGVSDHGRGRAENDVKKSPHGEAVKKILGDGFWMLDFGLGNGEADVGL
jgi:hypothetical protein